jgi:hypothetical protein
VTPKNSDRRVPLSVVVGTAGHRELMLTGQRNIMDLHRRIVRAVIRLDGDESSLDEFRYEVVLGRRRPCAPVSRMCQRGSATSTGDQCHNLGG